MSIEHDDTQRSAALASTPALKRKLGDTDFEIADSDDEGFGWDDDEDLPPMPSQWQGSEDILITRKPESEEEDHQDSDQSHEADENASQEGGDSDTEQASEG